MFLMRVSLGVLLVAAGLGYLFDPRVILRVNAFMREKVFKDSYALLSNRRIGAYMLAVGFLLLLISLRF